jgi:hypothetical protein
MPASYYVDTKATVYDMSAVSSFVDSPTGRVKAAIIHRETDPAKLAASIKASHAWAVESFPCASVYFIRDSPYKA